MNSALRFSAGFLPVFAAAAMLCAPCEAIAADASPWNDDVGSSARLIAARAEPGGHVMRAGLEIKLKPGWKTYWRYPGDSGVPPVFDFSASDNVKTVDVQFPAPEKFSDGAGGFSIGYGGDVILPLRVVRHDAGKPATLRLKLDYAACEKICVPAKAAVALELTGSAGAHDAALGAAEARVPRPAAIGDGGALAVRAVRREAGPGKPRVVVDLAAPHGAAVALFAEGPNTQWALPIPEPGPGADTALRRFHFELDGLPPGATASGATLRLTAVAPGQAIEVAFRLD
jgi:DsbC/DsbD-like thiol-disulfide interchange protein